jgi:hypothetical protein
MTPQWYEDNAMYSDRTAFVWAVNTVHVLVQSTFEALSSARVSDLVLSYVFTHNVEENLSEQHTQPARVMTASTREDDRNGMA